MPLLDHLAAYIADLSFENLPKQTIENAERHIFDSLGSVLAGASSEEARAVCDLVKEMVPMDGGHDIPVAGFGFSAPLPYAVLITCVAARLTETDDIELSSCTTPGAVIVPAALLTAYYAGESGKRLIEGVLAGYDVMTRLGAAVKGPEILYQGIWPTYLCGPIAAAATVSKVLGLNGEQIKQALAISLTMSTGLAGKIMSGLTSRWLTLGCAVQNGLSAALSAKRGFAGDAAMLDGPFQSIYGLDLDADMLLAGLGENFRIDAISMKPYCTARQALSPTEAFRRLLETYPIDPASIEDIQVIVPRQYSLMIDRPTFPEARMPSIVSVRYQMALAAFYEEDLYDIHRKNLRDEEKIHAFIKKVHITVSSDYTALFPGTWPGKILLRASGKTYEQEVLTPKGAPDRTMAWSDVAQKIARATRALIEPARVKEMEASVKALKQQPDIKAFLNQFPVAKTYDEP